MVDMRAETFTEIKIPSKWHSDAYKWSWAVIAAGKVFASPEVKEVPMLVWSINSTDKPAIRGISVIEKESVQHGWHGVAVFEGLLYTAPRAANHILVINASTEKVVARINVLDFTGPHKAKFDGIAVVGRAIVFAPHDTSCLLILSVDTRELGCIGINVDSLDGKTSVGVMAAGNQVWLFPREHQDITIVDIVKLTNATNEDIDTALLTETWNNFGRPEPGNY